MHAGTPSWSTAELTWALLLAAARTLPQQVGIIGLFRYWYYYYYYYYYYYRDHMTPS